MVAVAGCGYRIKKLGLILFRLVSDGEGVLVDAQRDPPGTLARSACGRGAGHYTRGFAAANAPQRPN